MMISAGIAKQVEGKWILTIKCAACKNDHDIDGGAGEEPSFTDFTLPCSPDIKGEILSAEKITKSILGDILKPNPDAKVLFEDKIMAKQFLGELCFSISERITTEEEFHLIYGSPTIDHLKRHMQENKQFALGVLWAFGGLSTFDCVPAYLGDKESCLIADMLDAIIGIYHTKNKAASSH